MFLFSRQNFAIILLVIFTKEVVTITKESYRINHFCQINFSVDDVPGIFIVK